MNQHIIIKTLQNYLEQGYDYQSIKYHLIAAGANPLDIDQAFIQLQREQNQKKREERIEIIRLFLVFLITLFAIIAITKILHLTILPPKIPPEYLHVLNP